MVQNMKKLLLLASAAALCATTPAYAQTTTTSTPSVGDRLGQFLGKLLGVGNQSDASLDGQWTANRRPLGNQRYEFETRVNAEVSAGRMSQADGARLKSEYTALVALETSYGSDNSYSAAERADLTARYNGLLQVLANGRYDGSVIAPVATGEVAAGQAAFNARVDARVTALKMTRSTATQLKADYAALVRVETGYLSDNVLSDSERRDLDTRLDALDLRVGDVAYTAPVTYKSRLDAIALAIPRSGLSLTLRNQLLVEYGDLARLEAAYARLTPTADERAYLERRLTNLELRAKVKR